MSRNVNWEAIPDRDSLEAGTYRMKITNIRELERDERNPFLTYLGTFEVEEPKESEGETHFERFRIGDENDPLGDKDVTWKRSMGGKNLKKLLKASGTPFLDTETATYEAARGNSFIGKIVKIAGRTGTQNEGQEFANMRGYFSLNSPEALQVGFSTNGASAVASVSLQPGLSQDMQCPICSSKVPSREYGKHLIEHKQNQGQA